MTHHVTFVSGATTGPEIFEHLKPLIAKLGVDIQWDERGRPTPGQDQALGSHESLLASARRTGTVLMAWEKGDRDRGQLVRLDARVVQCPLDDGQDACRVRAAGQLGDDAAKLPMQGHLGVHDVAADSGAAFDDGSCGLVTGSLDAEDGTRESVSGSLISWCSFVQPDV